MQRRTRNRICLWLIALGLLNLLVYTAVYGLIGGDAINGGIEAGRHYVRGHFIHGLEGRRTQVSTAVWVYSGVHSVSVPLTGAAILLALFTLARPHILATFRPGVAQGSLYIAVCLAIISIISVVVTAFLLADFLTKLLA